MLRWIERVLAVFGFLVLLTALIPFITFETVPTSNCHLSHFDTIVVLSCPALLNGQISPEGRARVLEGVKEFKAGRAPHIIFTGGASENSFIESQVMANFAEVQGVPPSAITVEGQSLNTIQNIYFTHQIMLQKGWNSAEIVSSPSHLPRAGLILEHYQFQWKEKACPWPPELGWQRLSQVYLAEIVETTILRWHGFGATPYLPIHKA